jgi:hypothetical protein
MGAPESERRMGDPVMRPREALEPELTRVIEAAKAAVTLGSLPLSYGVEIALTAGDIAPERLADYLGAVADAVEQRTGALPTLGRMYADAT